MRPLIERHPEQFFVAVDDAQSTAVVIVVYRQNFGLSTSAVAVEIDRADHPRIALVEVDGVRQKGLRGARPWVREVFAQERHEDEYPDDDGDGELSLRHD
jgi:hypothetical protein